MSPHTLPDRRSVLRGGAALIASVAMFAALPGQVRAEAATPHGKPLPSSPAPGSSRRSVPVGLL